MAAIACLLARLIEPNVFWAKATNEGLVTLMLLMLCAVALERLPWLGLLSRGIDSPSRHLAVARITAIAASTSAFLNNTAVVAALAQVLRRSCYHLPSQLLLPLSYAAILGGTLTLIGTSTNLIVSSFWRIDAAVAWHSSIFCGLLALLCLVSAHSWCWCRRDYPSERSRKKSEATTFWKRS